MALKALDHATQFGVVFSVLVRRTAQQLGAMPQVAVSLSVGQPVRLTDMLAHPRRPLPWHANLACVCACLYDELDGEATG